MSSNPAATGLQLRPLVKPNGELEISLLRVATPEPAPDEWVVRIEATPLNPSDIGLLFGAADISTAKVSRPPASPVVTAQIPERLMPGMAGRLGQSLPVGNEGACDQTKRSKFHFPLSLRCLCPALHGRDPTWGEYMLNKAIALYACA